MKPFKIIALLTFAIITLSSAAQAVENKKTVCEFGQFKRFIEVVYPEGTPLPCHVNYIKNGVSKTLWQAQAERGYCEEKAKEFIEKQKDWGWDCHLSTGNTVKPKAENKPADTTVTKNNENE